MLGDARAHAWASIVGASADSAPPGSFLTSWVQRSIEYARGLIGLLVGNFPETQRQLIRFSDRTRSTISIRCSADIPGFTIEAWRPCPALVPTDALPARHSKRGRSITWERFWSGVRHFVPNTKAWVLFMLGQDLAGENGLAICGYRTSGSSRHQIAAKWLLPFGERLNRAPFPS